MRAAIILLIVLVPCIVMELTLRYVSPASVYTSASLVGRRWNSQYWKPVNSLGYRDIEYSREELASKKNILIVGDSFVAGSGITRNDSRFSDMLRNMLGSQYNVNILAKPGWNTADEYRALKQYPYKTDLIIVSYYVDDIAGALNRRERKKLAVQRPQGITQYSCLLDYLYWSMGAMDNAFGRYFNVINNAYNNDKIWHLQQEQLRDLVGLAESRQSKLVVMLFPTLKDLSSEYNKPLEKVGSFFAGYGVHTINLLPELYKIGQPLVVSGIDMHPNEKVHRYVAEMLYAYLLADNQDGNMPK